MTCIKVEQKGSSNLDMQITEKIYKAIDSWSREVTGPFAEKHSYRNLDCGAIEQMANGLEKMVHRWSLAQEERAQDYARVADFLQKKASEVNREADNMQNTMQNIQLSVSEVTGDTSSTLGFSSEGYDTGRDNRFLSTHSTPLKGANVVNDSKDDSAEITHMRTRQYMDDTVFSSANYWCLVSESSSPGNACSFLENNTTADHVEHRFPRVNSTEDGYGGAEIISKDGNKEGFAFDCVNVSSDVQILLPGSKAESLTEALTFGENCLSQLKDRDFSGYGCQEASVTILKEMDDTKDFYKAKVEELQIALLERTMEYEVKMVEMEMKMRQLKSNNPSRDQDLVHKKVDLGKRMELALVPETQAETGLRRVEFYRKQNCRLQREKDSVTKELTESKKKLRQFDIQKRNLEDALQRVNFLQRELVKKEDELVDCQLKEKATKAKLHQVDVALQKARATEVDPMKLLKLVPALHEWFNSIRKAMLVKREKHQILQSQRYEENFLKILQEALPPRMLTILSGSAGSEMGFLSQSDGLYSEKVVDNPKEVSQEVQALENELEKLACRRMM